MLEYNDNVHIYPEKTAASYDNYIEKKLHTVYPMLYKPTLKNSKN